MYLSLFNIITYLNNINGIEKKYVYGELDVVRDSLINVKSFDYCKNSFNIDNNSKEISIINEMVSVKIEYIY